MYTAPLAATVGLGLIVIGSHFTTVENSEIAGDWQPKWTEYGQLVRPEGYREWIYLGSPLTLDALSAKVAAFPEYHNAYMHPTDHRMYKETKALPNDTILLNNLYLTTAGEKTEGPGAEVSAREFFPAFNTGSISP